MSSQYWRDRERDWKNRKKKTEKEQEEEIQEIYQNMLDSITKEIESFFSRYAAKEGISMAEAKKRVKQIEIEEYKRKAKKYVKEKDFSDKANEEMRLYNLTMKVNRLELLKANIGAELVNGTNDLETYYGDQLNDAVMEELERNVSILGPSVLNNAQSARAIIDSSFRNATYSERVWANQGVLRNNLVNIITAGIIQGKNARDLVPQLRKQFDVSRYQAERLLRTELTRARIQVQAESYKAEDIEKYEYIACGLKDCCPACKALDGKIFKVKDMEFGENAPPLHPNCHCATAPYSDRGVYEKWLDGLANGEHDLRFEEWKELEAKTNNSGALNGAWNNENDPNYKKRDEIAEALYAQITNRKKSFEIKQVAKNSGFTEEEVSNIYEHVFIRKHKFRSGEIKKFDPDYYMAHSWLRLRQGKDIQKHDITMLNHELAEEKEMQDSLDVIYEDSHERVQKVYNYQRELLEYLKDHDV